MIRHSRVQYGAPTKMSTGALKAASLGGARGGAAILRALGRPQNGESEGEREEEGRV